MPEEMGGCFLEMRGQTGLSSHPSGLQTAHRAAAQWFHAIENAEKEQCALSLYIVYILNQTDYSAGPKTLVSTTINIKIKCIRQKLCLQWSLAIVTQSYSKVAGILCLFYVLTELFFLYSSESGCLGLFGWWHIFTRVMNACLLNWKWKSLSPNQALRTSTSVSAGICSFVMPFYYVVKLEENNDWEVAEPRSPL